MVRTLVKHASCAGKVMNLWNGARPFDRKQIFEPCSRKMVEQGCVMPPLLADISRRAARRAPIQNVVAEAVATSNPSVTTLPIPTRVCDSRTHDQRIRSRSAADENVGPFSHLRLIDASLDAPTTPSDSKPVLNQSHSSHRTHHKKKRPNVTAASAQSELSQRAEVFERIAGANFTAQLGGSKNCSLRHPASLVGAAV
jgi:hypothetical protein